MKKSKLHKLREVLLELGISQKELAEKLDITPQSVSSMIGRENLSLAYMCKIAKILKISPRKLILTEEENESIEMDYLDKIISNKRRNGKKK